MRPLRMRRVTGIEDQHDAGIEDRSALRIDASPGLGSPRRRHCGRPSERGPMLFNETPGGPYPIRMAAGRCFLFSLLLQLGPVTGNPVVTPAFVCPMAGYPSLMTVGRRIPMAGDFGIFSVSFAPFRPYPYMVCVGACGAFDRVFCGADVYIHVLCAGGQCCQR